MRTPIVCGFQKANCDALERARALAVARFGLAPNLPASSVIHVLFAKLAEAERALEGARGELAAKGRRARNA